MSDNVPSKSQIVRYRYEHQSEVGMFIDIGEPDCWACGRYDPEFGDIFIYLKDMGIKEDTYRNNPSKYLDKMWNKADLERHHIIPTSRGGTNELSNFALLCASCHTDAPHVDAPDYFWKWLRGRKVELITKHSSIIEVVCNSIGLDFEKNIKFIMRAFTFYQMTKKNGSDKLHREIAKIFTFHPYSSWESYFRDEMFCLFSVVKTDPSLIPDKDGFWELVEGLGR